MSTEIDILVCTQNINTIGGSYKWYREVFSRWPIPVIVICPPIDGLAKCTELAEVNIPIAMKSWGLSSWKQYLGIRQTVAKMSSKNSGAVFTSHIFPECLGIPWASKSRTIAFCHGEELRGINSSLELRLLQKFSTIGIKRAIANSEATKNEALTVLPEDNISVVNPGVDCKLFAPNPSIKAEARGKLGLAREDFVLVTVGRIVARKNHELVLLALTTLSRQSKFSYKYLIVGDGDIEYLTTMVNDFGLQDRVIFHQGGSDIDIRNCLLASDLFVMPTLSSPTDVEGFGIAFIEAAAAGLPAVCGNSGGQLEAVIDGVTGVSIDPQNADELVIAIDILASNPDLYRKYSSNALARSQHFNWSSVQEKVWEIRNIHLRK